MGGGGARAKPGEQSSTKFLSSGQQIFSVKGQIAFAGPMVSVATLQLRCCGMKAAIDNI